MRGARGQRSERARERAERRCCGGYPPRSVLLGAASDQRRDWLQECREVRETYAAWSRAPLAERSRLYADYLLALDREQQASELYARLLREVGQTPLTETTGEIDALPRPSHPRWEAQAFTGR